MTLGKKGALSIKPYIIRKFVNLSHTNLRVLPKSVKKLYNDGQGKLNTIFEYQIAYFTKINKTPFVKSKFTASFLMSGYFMLMF